jgi:hypothetical protein
MTWTEYQCLNGFCKKRVCEQPDVKHECPACGCDMRPLRGNEDETPPDDDRGDIIDDMGYPWPT